MQTEIEVKFLEINPDQIRSRLKKAGAELVAPERLMRRRNFESPFMLSKNAWVRVRDESGRITMTYKQTNDLTVSGTQEVNLEVDDFDAARNFLKEVGLAEKGYQETKRESWLLDGVHLEIDTWPWLKPIIELEGESEQSLHEVASKLDLPWHHHLASDITLVYQKYYDFEPHDLYHYPILFGPVPHWLKVKK
jgi:adenylate cyclase class 2